MNYRKRPKYLVGADDSTRLSLKEFRTVIGYYHKLILGRNIRTGVDYG